MNEHRDLAKLRNGALTIISNELWKNSKPQPLIIKKDNKYLDFKFQQEDKNECLWIAYFNILLLLGKELDIENEKINFKKSTRVSLFQLSLFSIYINFISPYLFFIRLYSKTLILFL